MDNIQDLEELKKESNPQCKYMLFNKHSYPLCWQWAWNNMLKRDGETIKVAIIIEFHTRNRKKCPYCLNPCNGLLLNDLSKLDEEPLEQLVFNTLF